MATPAELKTKLFKALKSDRTVMLALAGADEGHAQPMTVQIEGDAESGPLWIFTSRETDLVEAMGQSHRAVVNFASKGHDLFASIEGELARDNDRATIDRLWNPYVAAWFEGGKDDPKLQLLRLDLEIAQVWLNENSLFAGVRMMLGRDPKKDYADKTGEVRLN